MKKKIRLSVVTDDTGKQIEVCEKDIKEIEEAIELAKQNSGMPDPSEELNVKLRNGHIYFQEDITKESIDKLIKLSETHIKNNLSQYSKPNYYLHINSDGGLVHETFRFLDFVEGFVMKYCNEVVSIIEGTASSGASLIAVSFPQRYMTSKAMIMLHEIQCETGFTTMSQTAARTNDWLKELNSVVTDIYLAKTKMAREELEGMMLREGYLFAKKAFELGFVDRIV